MQFCLRRLQFLGGNAARLQGRIVVLNPARSYIESGITDVPRAGIPAIVLIRLLHRVGG
jgi:hypothetical protein